MPVPIQCYPCWVKLFLTLECLRKDLVLALCMWLSRLSCLFGYSRRSLDLWQFRSVAPCHLEGHQKWRAYRASRVLRAGAELSGGQTGLWPLLVSNRYEGHLAPIDACQLLKLKIYKACHQLKGSRELNIDSRSHLELLHSVFQFPSANTYAISLVATGLQYSQAHTTYLGESMTVFVQLKLGQ